MDYINKLMVITGASRGIGKVIAEYFANLGCNLVITYNTNNDLSNELKNYLIEKYNVKVLNIKCDIKEESDINNLYSYINSNFSKIDFLVNNAALSMDDDFNSKDKDSFMNVLETNVVGTFLVTKYLSKLMDNGYIFNISSTDGIDTGSIYSIDYNASKAAINNMTDTLSRILNSKIYSICPNWVNTEAIKEMDQTYLKEEMLRVNQSRLIEPIEIASKIKNVIESDIKTGSIIRIDGDNNE